MQFLGRDRLVAEPLKFLVPGKFKVFGQGVPFYLGIKGEGACILGGRSESSRRGRGAGGNRLAFDEGLVEPPSAAVENLRHHLKGGAIGMGERHGVITEFNLGLAVAFRIHSLLGELLHFQGDHRGRGVPPRLETTEIAPYHRLDFIRIEISHDHAHDIRRLIVDIEVSLRLFHGVAVQVAGPPDHRPGVG